MQTSLRQTTTLISRLAAAGAGASLQQQTAACAVGAGAILQQQIAQQQHLAGQDGDCNSSAAVPADLAATSDTLPAARGDTSSRRSPGGAHLLISSSSHSTWQLPQPQQQWRCMASLADTLQDFQEQQQQRLHGLHVPQQQQQHPSQPQSQGYGPGQRTEFETRVAACASVSGLAALLESRPSARETAGALNKLSKLNKTHRTLLKQQLRALQQRWGSLRPLDDQQQQQLREVQQQHAQHEEELRAVLGKLAAWLVADQSALHVEQLVHVLGCLGSLGCVHQVPQGSALLLAVLQRLVEGLGAVQPRHLSFIATSLGQLQDQEQGISTHDDMPDAAAGPGADAAPPSAAGSTSSSTAASHLQQQEQQAASEVLRLLVHELCNAVQQSGPAMDATGLANFVAAMGRLGHYDWQTMRQIGSLTLRHTYGLNAAQVAKTLTGFTKLRHYDTELCARLAEAAQRDMASASGVHVTQIVWALAHQRFEEAGVFEAASHQVPVKAHELQPRHVANLAWAFAVRKAYSPALYDALAGRMVQLLQMDRGGAAGTEGQPEGSGSSTDSLFSVANDVVLPHHLSLVAWSFAKQGHKHEPMMLAIADRAAQMAGQMLPQNISNTAWAFGSLGVQHPAMFSALAAAAKASRLEGYNNQNITDLALGSAQAGHQDPELFELIAAATLNSLFDLSPHSLSDIITAFARARDPQADKILAAAVPAVINYMPRLSVQMLADILVSYAEVGLKDEALLAAAAQMLVVRVVPLEQDTDSQAKVIWTMKTLDWRDTELQRVLGTLIPNLADLM